MKRIYSIALALMMFFVFSFSDGMAVRAMEGNMGSIDDPSIPEASLETNDQECMPNAALVMFTSTKKMTKAGARSLLSKGNGRQTVGDLEITGAVSTFQTKSGLVKNSRGIWKAKRTGSASDRYTSVVLVRSKTKTTEQLIRILGARKDVRYAEPNYRIHALDISNDPYSHAQWSMQDAESAPNVSYQWNDKGVSGSESIVAVVDSGIDYTHPDLKNNMWENDHYPTLKGEHGFDFINGDDDPMDDNGHGTHCAGIIGAMGDNGEGITGVNKSIRLMALKILDEDGAAFLSHEVAAYNYINMALDLGEPIKAINNSWGGGEYSEILHELVDIVGKKGAVSVCAAGNSSSNNDTEKEYPACIESPYLISVAATGRDGKLASYSNFGQSVDVAAPGSDILSTVPYTSYNPTIYRDDQETVTDKYNNYEDPAEWGNVTIDDVYLNGSKYTDMAPEDQKPKIAVRVDDGGFLDDEGRSLHLTAKGLHAEDMVCITLPYTLDPQGSKAPAFSTMIQADSPEGSLFTGYSSVDFVDLPQGSDLDLATLNTRPITGTIISGQDETWRHIDGRGLTDKELKALKAEAKKGNADPAQGTGEGQDGENAGDPAPGPLDRQIVLVVYAASDGNYSVRLDDLGLSRQDITNDNAFGKYDFMSGTSMAAPYVTGSIALKTAELGKDADPEGVINETVSLVKSSPVLPIEQKGSLDFRMRPAELGPRMGGDITVDKAKGTITITGSGLSPSTGLKAEIGPDEEELTEAEVISSEDRKVQLKDKGWINNINTVRLTGYGDRQSLRDMVYLVGGKKKYTKVENGGSFATADALSTNGKNIFIASQNTIDAVSPGALDEWPDTLATIDPDTLFKQDKRDQAEYSMHFAPDLACSNGRIYSVVEYGASNLPEKENEDDSGVIAINGEGVVDADEGDEEVVSPANGTIYSGALRFISVKTSGGELVDRGALPSALEKTADWTMAAFNGKIYFIGGYSLAKGAKGFSTKVHVYDPATKKWSAGPALPEGRAGGRALQSGKYLIYTLGYSDALTGVPVEDQVCPPTLLFDGKTWKVSSVSEEDAIEPLALDSTVRRGGQEYIKPEANVSLIKGGILYTGMPAANYGDTFTYQIASDSYADTGYNYIREIDEQGIFGVTAGKTFAGSQGNNVYRMNVNSGLIQVSATKKGKGTVKGTGNYLPGNTVNATLKASKYYRIKSIKRNGAAVKLGKNKTTQTVKLSNMTANQKLQVTFGKYKVKVTATRKGKGTVKGTGTFTSGGKTTVTVKAAKYYRIKYIKRNGKIVKLGKNKAKRVLKLTGLASNQKIEAAFVKYKVRVTSTSKGKGTVTGTNRNYTSGTTAKIKVKAAKGYYIKSIKVGKKAIKVKKGAKAKTFYLKKLTKNQKVTVVFAKKKK